VARPRGSPDAFKTSLVRPPDFDAFWADVLEQARRIPLNPSCEPVPHRSTDEAQVFEIGYDSLDGVRIVGRYCRPRETYLPAPYPALLLVPGYISKPTQLAVGDAGSLSGAAWLEPLMSALGGPVELYAVTHAGATDNDALDAWLAGKLGVDPMPKFLSQLT